MFQSFRLAHQKLRKYVFQMLFESLRLAKLSQVQPSLSKLSQVQPSFVTFSKHQLRNTPNLLSAYDGNYNTWCLPLVFCLLNTAQRRVRQRIPKRIRIILSLLTVQFHISLVSGLKADDAERELPLPGQCICTRRPPWRHSRFVSSHTLNCECSKNTIGKSGYSGIV